MYAVYGSGDKEQMEECSRWVIKKYCSNCAKEKFPIFVLSSFNFIIFKLLSWEKNKDLRLV